LITIGLTKKGTISLVPSTRGDREIVRDLGYVLSRRDGLGVTYWTYLKDILRDIDSSLRIIDKSVKPALESLISQSEGAKETYTFDQIDRWFGPDRSPFSYQCHAISFGMVMERVLIADDVGLGKTIESLGIVLGALALDRIKRAVFVVPASLKTQWYDQILEFAPEKITDSGLALVNGDKKKRKRIYSSNWKILIVNPEVLVRDFEYFERHCHDIGAVVLDEASCIRNPDTATSNVIKRLFDDNRYKIALTATPVENSLLDLFSVFEWLDKRIFPSREHFSKTYVDWVLKKFKVKKRTASGFREFMIKKPQVRKYKNLDQIAGKIKPCYIRRRVADVGAELPSLIASWEVIRLSKREREVYTLCKEAEEDNPELAEEALSSWLQGLRQACNSVSLVAPKDRAPSSKIKRLKELLETELAGEQVIVFTDYARFAKLIAQKLPMKVSLFTGEASVKKNRDSAMRSFIVGDRRVLVATSAAERGHNLQNASVVVNIDLPFNPARLKQRIGRIARVGSEHKTIRMINFIAADTVEESIIRKKIYDKRKLTEILFGDDDLSSADPLRNLSVSLNKLEESNSGY
jgi:SNF2 family DNA or RNA helicase